MCRGSVMFGVVYRSSVRSRRILGSARVDTTKYGDEYSQEHKQGIEAGILSHRICIMSDDENELGQQAQPQPVAIHLPPVKEFDPKGDPSTISQRWQKWKKSFVYFLNATGVRNDSQKRAALLHLVGDEVQDIFETLGDVGITYEQAVTKLDIHFDIKKNIPFEGGVFHEAGQESGENIDSYVTRLKRLIIHCEYGDATQNEIRDQVIAKCKSSKLRKRSLQEPDLTLEKVLTIGKLMEQSDPQTKKIEQQNGACSSTDTVQESFSDPNKIRPNKFQHKDRMNTGGQRNSTKTTMWKVWNEKSQK